MPGKVGGDRPAQPPVAHHDRLDDAAQNRILEAVLPFLPPPDARKGKPRVQGVKPEAIDEIISLLPPETPEDNVFAMYEVAGLSRAEIFDRAAQIRRRVT